MNLALVFGLIASSFIAWLSFTNNHKHILKISAAIGVFATAQYALLGESVATAMSVVSLAYALVMLIFSGKYPLLNSNKVTASLLAAYTVVFFWLNGIAFNLQLLAYVGSITMVAIMLIKNPYTVKWLMLVAGVSWSIFQYNIEAYGQLIGQSAFFAGVFYSFWKLNKQDKEPTVKSAPEPVFA